MPTSPVVRWGVRLVAGALVVALAALLGVRAYGKSRLAAAEREFAKRVGPQERSAPIGVKVAEEENASIFLRNGAEAMILPGDDRPLVGELAFEPVGRWSERNRAELRRILAANGAALELLRSAGRMTESDFGPLAWDEKTRELTTPPLLNLLTAQRLLLGDARIALVDREPRRVLSDAAAMATMATALEREAPGVELQMGLACEGMLLALLEEAIADPSTERAALVKLQAILPDVDLRAAWRRSNLWEQGEIERHVAEVLSDPAGARQKP
ncbi:MAG TPA: hypothetical protein VMT45_15615, partial [Thermoanaerobaculaceae bacterium]|nr:hypothetical protein [Thermoanaerobaculaceae bacterium]